MANTRISRYLVGTYAIGALPRNAIVTPQKPVGRAAPSVQPMALALHPAAAAARAAALATGGIHLPSNLVRTLLAPSSPSAVKAAGSAGLVPPKSPSAVKAAANAGLTAAQSSQASAAIARGQSAARKLAAAAGAIARRSPRASSKVQALAGKINQSVAKLQKLTAGQAHRAM